MAEEPAAEIADEFSFLENDGQKLRALVFSYMANADIDGRILAENMNIAAEWIKDGTVPMRPRKPKEHVQP
ncbi:MAG TPA: hypothetical protein VFE77_03100 [Rhodanobacter sp.]|nr:hypothetical protein [Rhodanobacter sp.]